MINLKETNLEEIKSALEGKFDKPIIAYSYNPTTKAFDITFEGTLSQINEGALDFANKDELKSLTIPEGVTSIANGEFDGMSRTVDITLPNSYLNGRTSETLNSELNVLSNLGLSGDTIAKYVNDRTYAVDSQGVLKNNTTIAGIPQDFTGDYTCENISHILKDAANGCTNLQSILINPRTYGTMISLSIGDGAFKNCTNLTSILFGERIADASYINVTKQNIFEGCINLVKLPNILINKITSEFLKDCAKLTEVNIVGIGQNSCLSVKTFPENFNIFKISRSIDIEGITEDLDLSNINFSEMDIHLCIGGFKNCILPESIVWSGDRTPLLLNVSGLKLFKTTNKTTKITFSPYGTGSDNASIETIDLSESTDTNLDLFRVYSPNLQTLVLPTTISNESTTSTSFTHMCSGCTKLTSVTLPNNIPHIGQYMFMGCSALLYIEIPQSVLSIKMCAFLASGLTTIDLNAQSIGESAFENCSNLETVICNEGLISIDNEAFKGCSKLTDIYLPTTLESLGSGIFTGSSKCTVHYAGTEEQWNQIEKRGIISNVLYNSTPDAQINSEIYGEFI